MAILHLNFRSDSIARSVYPIVFLPDAPGRGDKPFQTLYGRRAGDIHVLQLPDVFSDV